MDLKDMILVTENDRGTETNMLMTLDDYKSFIAVDDMSELADNLLQLGRTLGEADNFAEYYRASNVTVFARFCKDDVQLGYFLQGFYNDSKQFRFDKEASSSECVAKLKEIGMTDKGWVDDFNLHYESVDRLFERGQTFHNFNDHDYMVLEALSPRNLVVMDMNKEYGDGANPVILKSEFIMSLCEQLIGGTNLGAKQKSIIDRCTASVYRDYQQRGYTGTVPTLQDFRAELLKQDEPEAREIALAIELFTHGSLNTFAKPTNVDTDNRLICYDILDLGKQLMPIGMLVVLDSILNRITQNRAKGKQTFIFIDEIYLLFQHEYSANFLFTLWKRVRKYGAYATGITQNVDDLLQSHTARTMLANSEFLIMLNQASTDRIELAKLLNISDLQLSYITNVDAGHGLIKVGSSLVPFANKFPKNTKLYKLMTTKPGEGA